MMFHKEGKKKWPVQLTIQPYKHFFSSIILWRAAELFCAHCQFYHMNICHMSIYEKEVYSIVGV